MTPTDTIQMMERCAAEIQGLRAQIERLTPKAEAYDSIRLILGLLPAPSQAYGEDLAWMLRKAIADEKDRRDKNAVDGISAET